MATAPDTSTLTSSAQVFAAYTLPQVRAIHKSLHAQVDEKSARLRTQVGNSYRELLGTADAIVRMRDDMLAAQDVLARMGGMCGRTVVGAKVAGLAKFRSSSSPSSSSSDFAAEDDNDYNHQNDLRLSRVARVQLLNACGLAVGRLLKGGAEGRGDRLVLAAKVLVLKRLLVSSFGAVDNLHEETRIAVEGARKSMNSLRRRLLRAVEKVLEKVSDEVDRNDILKALTAYSLASSSGAKDVLRHFLSVRAEAMVYEFDFEEHEKERDADNVLKGLDLYTRTLLDVQALVPNKLSGALSRLKKQHLLADESLQGLEGLRLDIYERWCGDEIQYFTPFIRHDDLDGTQAREMLTGWAKKGGETLLQGLRRTLEHVSEFKTIVSLRTSVLQHWINDGGKARGFDPSTMLNGLREAIDERLLQILETRVAKLKLVGSEVTATIEAWQPGTSDQHRSLWSEEMVDMDVSGGANQITHEIISRLYGRNDAVARVVTSYESWRHLISSVGDLIDQLKRQRWDDDVEEIEDEDVIAERQKLLSKDDPELLQKKLDETIKGAFDDLDKQMASAWKSSLDSTDNGHIAMYILRILRDIRGRLPYLEGIKSFGLESVPSLHEKLAIHVSTPPLEEFASSALTRRRVAGRALWEGEPALPTQPSTGTFKLLRDLIMSMGDAGLDLWTPAAVKTLKQSFGKQLVEVWRKELNSETMGEKETDGTSENVSEEPSTPEESNSAEASEEPPQSEKTVQGKSEKSKDIYIQWLYDIHLFQQCLGAEVSSEESFRAFVAETFEKTGLEDGAKDKLAKASQEYWKRTSLLFGLLA
ncbi:dodecenoyl-CoA isomerase [Hypoxylon texense]